MSSSDGRNRNESVGMWAWLLPAAYAAHVIEEAFGGGGFMAWMYAGGGVRLSLAAFLGLNAAGVTLLCLAAWAARRTRACAWPLASGAAVVFVNGVWHAAICAMTRSYIPGVVTGLVVYLPVGGTVDLSLPVGRGYHAEWFDPRSGALQPAAALGGLYGLRVTAPAQRDASGHMQDWVLILRS